VPKLHLEIVGTILHFNVNDDHQASKDRSGCMQEYEPFVPAKNEKQLEQELHNYSFALPTPTRKVLPVFTAIIHLLSNKKGTLRSVSNASIYTSNDDDPKNSNQDRSRLIIHWFIGHWELGGMITNAATHGTLFRWMVQNDVQMKVAILSKVQD
jgi:hypothetical protein